MSEPKLASIRLLLLDVDGVLTDGSIYFDHQGEELKAFNSKDGLGLRFLMEAGIQVGIVTARQSKALQHRCDNLGVDLVFQGMQEKAAAMEEDSSYLADDSDEDEGHTQAAMVPSLASSCQDVSDPARPSQSRRPEHRSAARRPFASSWVGITRT